MRVPIIAGNWKCHLTRPEAENLVEELKRAPSTPGVDVVLCPTFTALDAVASAVQGSDLRYGAQNVYWENQGAFTGEISVAMLDELGCGYCIIGHSERRTLFGESDAWVMKKLHALLKSAIVPIVCIGESLEEREAGKTWNVIESQLRGSLEGVGPEQATRIVLAYEPVWAIGTGKTATPEQAQEVHAMIRSWMVKQWGESIASQIRIQYGGSVKPDNAGELLSQQDIDGALVGGASLKAEAFIAIVQAAASTNSIVQ